MAFQSRWLLNPRGWAFCGELRSIPSARAISIHGVTREMSSKSMSPPVRRQWKICWSQVVPHLLKGDMTTSVGRGQYDPMESAKSSRAIILDWIWPISARLRARCGPSSSIGSPPWIKRAL